MKRAFWWWPAVLVALLVGYGAANFQWGLDNRIGMSIAQHLPTLFIFAIFAIGLDVIAGDLGLLHLGAAGTVAIGAYMFSILTTVALPFEVSFWPAILVATAVASFAGMAMTVPVLGLRGDYLAIVTLGFGEIVRIALKNLEAITQGSRGVRPVARPVVFGHVFSTGQPRNYTLYWILLAAAAAAVVLVLTTLVRRSKVGRAWKAIRDDELAANAMGIRPSRLKLLGIALGSAWLGLGGALYASRLGTSGEPSNYSFNISIIILCMVVLGGMGKIWGALLGAILLQALDLLLLPKLGDLLGGGGGNVPFYADPTNYRFMIFGLTLVLVTRLIPKGLAPGDVR